MGWPRQKSPACNNPCRPLGGLVDHFCKHPRSRPGETVLGKVFSGVPFQKSFIVCTLTDQTRRAWKVSDMKKGFVLRRTNLSSHRGVRLMSLAYHPQKLFIRLSQSRLPLDRRLASRAARWPLSMGHVLCGMVLVGVPY